MAMYRAKERGKNAYELFAPSMNQDILHRLSLERDLRRALEREEFTVHYQPKVDLASGAVTGAEALVRWERPDLGMVSPAEFIPLAEDTGLIVGIGQWVLEQACRQAKRWRRDILKDFTVAVNLSARQFQQPDLVDMVARTLRETGLEPGGLKLEITESMVMYDVEDALATMERLTDMGVALSMDDFGTGYSSLSYLKRFPLTELKIDKSFIDDIPQDHDAFAITRATVFMARSLGLRVVAEGVETEEQLAFLRALQCDQMQGFLFSRPIPDREFTALLKEKRRI
jgi:EAL domain-containing protein (putative c-di-GMP-specific phosphodiesterase class I)